MIVIAFIFLLRKSGLSRGPSVSNGLPHDVQISIAMMIVVRLVLIIQGLFLIIPTSGVSGPDTLWRVRWTRLLEIYLIIFDSGNVTDSGFHLPSSHNSVENTSHSFVLYDLPKKNTTR